MSIRSASWRGQLAYVGRRIQIQANAKNNKSLFKKILLNGNLFVSCRFMCVLEVDQVHKERRKRVYEASLTSLFAP